MKAGMRQRVDAYLALSSEQRALLIAQRKAELRRHVGMACAARRRSQSGTTSVSRALKNTQHDLAALRRADTDARRTRRSGA